MWGIATMVGYAAGVYDIFHVGHLRALQIASAMCDSLIVGVIADDVVVEYKGIAPIMPLQHRMEIIRSLECVDAVVECRTRDFCKQWELLKYDVAFSGEDWCNDPTYMEWARMLDVKHGVSLKFIPNTSDISTTDIKKRIRGLP